MQETRENLRVLSARARARARARPALVKRGASGPCPKKCLKIFPHRARACHAYFSPILFLFQVFQNKNSYFIHISFIFHSYLHGSFIFHFFKKSYSIQETLVNFDNWALKCSRTEALLMLFWPQKFLGSSNNWQ